MKYLKYIFVIGIFATTFTSCYDEKMEWGDPYTHPDAKDLPLELQEKISRYEVLTKYTDFTLGVGIDFNLYMSDEAYRNIINQNFKEVTPGNEMKQSSIMNGTGELVFSETVSRIIEQLKSAGLTVYGHTLVWHSQQQATYLNSLIAPTIIPGTPGSSLIVNGDFEGGSLDGWNIPYYAEAVSVVTDAAIDGTHSMQVAVGDWGGDKYNMQVNSPKFQIINGHRYEISFFIKSDGEGKVGLDFPNTNLTNQYPYTNGSALTTTSAAWTKVTYNPTATPDGMVATTDNPEMNFRLLLGAVKNMTYYIDGVEVIDLDAKPAEPTYVNLVAHGIFEEYTAGGDCYPDWNAWGGTADPKRVISDEGDGYNGGKALIIHSQGTTTDYGVQATTNLTEALIVGHEYHVEAMMRSSVANGKARIQFQGGSATYLAADEVGLSWTKVEHDFTAENANTSLFFDLGEVSADYYIDNVVVYDKASLKASVAQKTNALRGGPTTIEKTPEEKAEIIGAALESWISQMVSHYKDVVRAWDVVNEPMNDNGSGLKTGEGRVLGANEFYWQDYLGKDYAVKAFKLARQYGSPETKLFINDYNLESANGGKLDGLIQYVNYIESQGAKVDGIGTQLHLNINWTDTTGIKTMFQKLAATGKLIKISELDIAIGNSSDLTSPVSPTADQYAQQAELYRVVAAMYNQYIPSAQRYGITVWGVSDNEKEHEYWLKNDAPCLWDANYARKYAYKGFADGLAGRDISANFSGELVY